MRIQRCKVNPAGDSRKEAELQPVWQRYTDFIGSDKITRADKDLLSQYRWMVEEYRVSLFAQELRTPYPVSSKRLNTLWDELTDNS
jgi:ATP-dependent helicase HrpA